MLSISPYRNITENGAPVEAGAPQFHHYSNIASSRRDDRVVIDSI